MYCITLNSIRGFYLIFDLLFFERFFRLTVNSLKNFNLTKTEKLKSIEKFPTVKQELFFFISSIQLKCHPPLIPLHFPAYQPTAK